MLRVTLFFLSLTFSWAAYAASPSILYLTWTDDPTTTMTIQWHSDKDDEKSEVLFRQAGKKEWKSKEGVFNALHSTDYLAHTVELDQLKPGTDYEFMFPGKKKTYKFRTMPEDLDRPVRFAIGGDAYYYLNIFRRMCAQVAAQDPDFVVVGGDIAYTNGRRSVFQTQNWEINRWRTFLHEWKVQMVTKDGRLIPLLPVVGNHDVKGSQLDPFKNQMYFYEIFTFPKKNIPYRSLDFGSYLSLTLLDTGHTYPINGKQTDWLANTLAERENFSYKFAAYHVGAYPSVYPYAGAVPRKIRGNWCPIFEQYHLNGAFEHHSHTFKRTHPIKQEKVDPNGVVYFGDGSWGVSPRKVKNADMWYMSTSARENAVFIITLDEHMGAVEALSIDGKVIDTAVTYPSSNLVSFDESRLLR
ncbi:MAG: metallophosphoesterase family protein [Verrucomicrobia bacterium]|nr:metallophosphoesterase family protein [Verrucomicrobiota bacterium]